MGAALRKMNGAPKGGGRSRNPNHRSNGNHNNHSNKANVGMTAEQKKQLSKVRAVIPRERASDDEVMTMLMDFNDPDKVIQHFFEGGAQESEWNISTTKRTRKKEHHNNDHRSSRPTAQPTATPRDRPDRPQPNARPAQPPRPAAEPAAKPAPNTHRPAPLQANAETSGGSWASRTRANAPAQAAAPPLPMPQQMEPGPMNGAPEPANPLPANPNLSFGGYNAPEMAASYIASDPIPTMANEVLLPAPTGVIQSQSGGFMGAPPMPQQPVPKESKIHLESEINSHTHREGDILDSASNQMRMWQGLVAMWDKRELIDLKLKAEPGEMRISVHAVVIAAASPSIAHALNKCYREGGAPPPELLVHCECAALEECVRFCYTGELRVSDSTVQTLWYAASVLEVQGILDMCCEWAHSHIHGGNALLINSLAEQYQIPDLKVSVDKFVLSNLQSLVHEPDFLTQQLARVIDLLSSDDARFENELEVFSAVVRWIQHDPAERTAHLGHLMRTVVRLPQLDFEELEKVECNELVSNDAGAKSLMHDVYRYLAAPEQRRLAMNIPGTRARSCYNQHPSAGNW